MSEQTTTRAALVGGPLDGHILSDEVSNWDGFRLGCSIVGEQAVHEYVREGEVFTYAFSWTEGEAEVPPASTGLDPGFRYATVRR